MLTIGEKPAGVNVEVRYGGDYTYLILQISLPVFQRWAPQIVLTWRLSCQIDQDVIVIELANC